MPMLGLGIAVSTLVGRRQGQKKPGLAARTTWSALQLTMFYMCAIAALYVLIPKVFLWPFAAQANPEEFRPVAALTVSLLRIVALYTAFDGMNIVFLSALKGAGDTRFPLYATTGLSWVVLIIPSWGLYFAGHRSVYVTWWLASAYIIVLAFVMLARFMGGKWRTMRVIEEVVPHVPPHPSVPLTDVE
jgi:MATE family multidrug resistance protein